MNRCTRLNRIVLSTIWASTICLLIACIAPISRAQQADAVVPTLVSFSGTLTDIDGKPLTGVVGVTFCLYRDEHGGSPLWIESQNVQTDKNGHYSVMLGSTNSHGLPTDLFASGEARWLGVQEEGQAEQPRILLLSVPYALKAGDAATIGGLPPSAFVLAAPQNQAASTYIPQPASGQGASPDTATDVTTSGGTADYLPLWDSASDITSSIVFQSGTGTTAKIGIGTTTPTTTLDIKGGSTVRGVLSLPASGAATAAAGKNSQPLSLVASAFSSGTSTAVNQTFHWLAEPAANDTASPSATLNLLFGEGTAVPAETGLHIAGNGQITFATGQTFPGTGAITGISTASGSGLSGGGTTGTLNLSVPSAGISNAMLKNSKLTLNANSAGGITTPGAMTLGSTYTIGLKPCGSNQILQYIGTAWACSSVGTGTITGVTAGTDLTGGGAAGTITLNLDTTKVPQLASNNTFTGQINVDNLIYASASVPSGFVVFGGNESSAGTGIGGSGASTGVYGSTGSGFGVWGNATSNGDGVYGGSYAGSGVYGNSENSYGVVGNGGYGGGLFEGTLAGSFSVSAVDQSFYAGAYGQELGQTTETFGLWGYSQSTAGVGTYGQAVSASNQGTGFAGGGPYGVWGDTGSSNAGGAVLATADDNYGVVAANNSVYPTAFFVNAGSDDASNVLETFGGEYGGYCYIDVMGNLSCSGALSGVVSAAGARKVAVNAISSPENWFEDAGSGQLSSGQAVVNIEAVFGETVNTEVDYHVFLTPNGDCKGLYVAQKSPTSFVVHELGGGTSSIAFDYRIMAKRKGFEQLRLVDKTEQVNAPRPKRATGTRPAMPTAQEIRKAQEAHLHSARVMKPKLTTK